MDWKLPLFFLTVALATGLTFGTDCPCDNNEEASLPVEIHIKSKHSREKHGRHRAFKLEPVEGSRPVSGYRPWNNGRGSGPGYSPVLAHSPGSEYGPNSGYGPSLRYGPLIAPYPTRPNVEVEIDSDSGPIIVGLSDYERPSISHSPIRPTIYYPPLVKPPILYLTPSPALSSWPQLQYSDPQNRGDPGFRYGTRTGYGSGRSPGSFFLPHPLGYSAPSAQLASSPETASSAQAAFAQAAFAQAASARMASAIEAASALHASSMSSLSPSPAQLYSGASSASNIRRPLYYYPTPAISPAYDTPVSPISRHNVPGASPATSALHPVSSAPGILSPANGSPGPSGGSLRLVPTSSHLTPAMQYDLPPAAPSSTNGYPVLSGSSNAPRLKPSYSASLAPTMQMPSSARPSSAHDYPTLGDLYVVPLHSPLYPTPSNAAMQFSPFGGPSSANGLPLISGLYDVPRFPYNDHGDSSMPMPISTAPYEGVAVSPLGAMGARSPQIGSLTPMPLHTLVKPSLTPINMPSIVSYPTRSSPGIPAADSPVSRTLSRFYSPISPTTLGAGSPINGLTLLSDLPNALRLAPSVPNVSPSAPIIQYNPALRVPSPANVYPALSSPSPLSNILYRAPGGSSPIRMGPYADSPLFYAPTSPAASGAGFLRSKPAFLQIQNSPGSPASAAPGSPRYGFPGIPRASVGFPGSPYNDAAGAIEIIPEFPQIEPGFPASAAGSRNLGSPRYGFPATPRASVGFPGSPYSDAAGSIEIIPELPQMISNIDSIPGHRKPGNHGGSTTTWKLKPVYLEEDSSECSC